MTSTNLIDALSRGARAQPDNAAVIYLPDEANEPQPLSYGELHRKAIALAVEIRNALAPNDPRGCRVVIALPSGLDFWVAFYGTIYAGACAVATYAPKPQSRSADIESIATIAGLSGSELLLTKRDQEFENEAALSGLSVLFVDGLSETDTPLAPAIPRSDDLALMLFTSGSTGNPKGVTLTHGMIGHNFSSMRKVFGLDEQSHSCAWLPNCHVAGFYMRMLPIITRASCIEFPTQSFLMRPEYWLEVISDYRVRLSAAPAFAYDMLNQSKASLDPARLDLSCFDLAITGGEPIKPDCAETFARKFAPLGFPKKGFTPYYGMTETLCTTIRYPDSALPALDLSRAALKRNEALPASSEADRLSVLSCGRPLDDNRVLIIHPETHSLCSETEIGEIVVAGGNVTPGYWGRDPSETRVTVNGHGDYFRTGDLGVHRDGEIYVTGRIKELLIVRGKNHYPKDIEDTLLDLPDTPDHFKPKAFAIDMAAGEALALAIETSAVLSPGFITTLRQSILRRHGLSVEFLTVLPPGGLPLTNSGKVPRSVCKDNALSGVWKPYLTAETQVAADTNIIRTSETGETVLNLLSDVLNRPRTDLRPTDGLVDLGIDSIQSVKLLRLLQDRIQPAVELCWLYEDLSVQQLADRIDGSGEGTAPQLDESKLFGKLDQLLDQASQIATQGQGDLFVTGVTGFLGSYLLRDLLQQSDRQLHCLVRAGSVTEGQDRIRSALSELSGFQEDWMRRIHVVLGSLGPERFGLETHAFEALSKQVTGIIHNAANVNFVAPYERLRDVNVASNLDIIRLATTASRKPVHYISTVAVFNAPERDALGTIKETDWLDDPNTLYSGYAKTKWMSESLYRHARERGLEVKVYRPGLVLGDATNGYCHTDDFVCRFLKGCLQINRFPYIGLQLDMTPVDYAARSIVSLALKGNTNGDTFHLLNPEPIRLSDLAEWFAERGYPVELQGSAAWHDGLRELSDGNAMFPVTPFMLDRSGPTGEGILEFFATRPLNLATEATLNELNGTELCPPIDDELLSRYVDYFVDTGFLDPPP